MNTCTHHTGGMHTSRCTARAVWVIGWSDPIDDGWTQTTHRRYCSEHADQQRDRLTKRGVRFDVETAP